MAKTNFTKAEEALTNALQKISVDKLYELTEKDKKMPSESTEADIKALKAHLELIQELGRDLKRLQNLKIDIYADLGIKKKELNALLEKADTLTTEEWDKVIHIKDQIKTVLKEFSTKSVSNDQLIKDQRKKHITKRFNVNDKWLPLK
jgi:hypothetical protein